MRTATRNGLTTRQFLNLLAPGTSSRSRFLNGVSASLPAYSALQHASGITSDLLAPLWLYPPGSPDYADAPFRTSTSSRFCPACLSEDPHWRHAWRSRLSFSCPTHKVLLLDRCPVCEHQTGRWDLQRHDPRALARCSSCWMPLSPAPTLHTPISSKAARTQHHLDLLYRRAPPIRDATEADLWLIASYANTGANGVHAHRRDLHPARLSELMPRVLAAAQDPLRLRALTGDDTAALHGINQGARTPAVRTVVASALETRPRSSTSRTLRRSVPKTDLRWWNIPQRLPDDLYAWHLQHVEPRTRHITTRVIPVLMVSAIERIPPAKAAELLDIAPLVSGSTTHNYVHAARASEASDLLHTAISDCITDLAARERRDYQRLREGVRSLREIQPDAFAEICVGAGQRLGHRGVKARSATAYIAMRAAHIDVRRTAPIADDDRPVIRTAYQHFTTGQLPRLADDLDELADELAAAIELAEHLASQSPSPRPSPT